MQNHNPATIYLKDYQVPDYLIEQVELVFDLELEHTRVISTLSMKKNSASTNTASALELSGEALTLISVALNEQVLDHSSYQVTAETLLIHTVPQDQVFKLRIENIINPKANNALEGLYLSNGMFCTQCEAQGFRKITYYLDRPDVMSKFTTTIRADKSAYPVLLSNGNKIGGGDLDANRHWVCWQDPFAKPCYLFALVAGQLECISDSFTTMSGRDCALEIYVEAHDKDKCAHAMRSLQKAMRWDEQVYGREYDLDLYMIVAVGHFNMGAMENKGLNIFNAKFVLARPDTATDADYENIEGVIAHEYFHNWTGNRITCRDWFQLSLKEGFTVFRDQEFSADHGSRGVKRIEDVNLLRTRQFAEDASPLSHPIRPESYIEISNFYTLTVYEKGAEIVRMLHTLLGAEGFRKGSDLYFARHDGQAVTCDDFVQALADANQKDLSQFKRWYSRAGTPVLTIEQRYDSDKQALFLSISQTSTATEPLHIPVRLSLLNPDGSPARLISPNNTDYGVEITLELTETKQDFVFNQLAQKPVLSALRGFSAPVKLHLEQTLEELAFLLSHDTDPFNRWEAGQKLATQLIFDSINAIQNQQPMQMNSMLVETFKTLLTNEWDDLSYLSLLLTLPSEAYLAEQMQTVDVEAIYQAREFVRTNLAQQLQTYWLELYQTYHQHTTALDATAIGQRRIKNLCLDYLTCLSMPTTQQLAQQQFDDAKNMTDQIAALSAIVNSAHPGSETCLTAFYRQWQSEALVIDKWFSLQACAPLADTFDKVQQLMQHPSFDLKNPNRARSLIGAFCQANQLRFHAANGEGYRFLADQVIKLNSLNPQIASRMITPLTSWHRFDSQRQQLMQAQLERIIQTPDISKDVYEVASKSLY